MEPLDQIQIAKQIGWVGSSKINSTPTRTGSRDH